jgi:hypothetical protein
MRSRQFRALALGLDWNARSGPGVGEEQATDQPGSANLP